MIISREIHQRMYYVIDTLQFFWQFLKIFGLKLEILKIVGIHPILTWKKSIILQYKLYCTGYFQVKEKNWPVLPGLISFESNFYCDVIFIAPIIPL